VLGNTLQISAVATLVSLVLGYLIALHLARWSRAGACRTWCW
jgi:ABC-type spermidine/putrescine transport system permease subunit I